MDLFCIHGVGQTVELCNFCSHGGGQTVELWNCSVVMVVDRLQDCGTVLCSLSWADCRTVDLFCSHGGGQTVELCTCPAVMVVGRVWNCGHVL